MRGLEDARHRCIYAALRSKSSAGTRAALAPEEESRWARHSFVEEAGWAATVNEDYRFAVAAECAAIVVEGMEEEPAAEPAD